MRDRYQRTIDACFTGYIVQAIVNNFVPFVHYIFQDFWYRKLEGNSMCLGNYTGGEYICFHKNSDCSIQIKIYFSGN